MTVRLWPNLWPVLYYLMYGPVYDYLEAEVPGESSVSGNVKHVSVTSYTEWTHQGTVLLKDLLKTYAHI